MIQPPLREAKISVGVLTFQRPSSLARTLGSIVAQVEAIAEVLVIDNDPAGSARDVALEAAGQLPINYVIEAKPGVSAARNRALDEATGDVLVFIDDDESVADPSWPGALIRELRRSGASLVGGPVRTSFDDPPPRWIADGGFFEREEPPTGTPQTWLRTGNVAIDLHEVRGAGIRFDEAFGASGGEDVAFSRDALAAGLTLSWANQPAVVEHVPRERMSLEWLGERERRATANYVRARGKSMPRHQHIARAIATVVLRSATGVFHRLVGTARGQKHVSAQGALDFARVWGTMEGLVGRSGTTYASSAPTNEVH